MLFISPNGEYPKHIGDIKLQEPTWEPGQALPEGWIYVNSSEIPSFNLSMQKIREINPELRADGQYYQVWEIVEPSTSEKAVINNPSSAANMLEELGLTADELTALFLTD